MRKVTISSEKVGAIMREYLREEGLDITNGVLEIHVDLGGPDGIKNWKLIAILPHEKPNLRVINGKM